MRPGLPAAIAIAAAACAADPPVEATSATTATVRVENGRWLERTIVRAATASGSDEKIARREFARRVYLSDSTDGIDLTRPAVVTWRGGATPATAVIPVGKRNAFLNAFGSAPQGEPPLVRVGDRDGSVVYTQTSPRGLREYRLLVVDGVAYFAGSLAECRALAETPPVATTGSALTLTATGPSLVGRLRALGADCGVVVPGLDALTASFARGVPMLGAASVGPAISDLAGQLETASVGLRPQGDDGVVLTASATVRQGSALAAWLPRQRNAAPRTAVLAEQPGAIATLWWGIESHGAVAALINDALAAAKAAPGGTWSDAVEESVRQSWALADTAEAGAISLLRAKGDAAIATVIETTRAAELAVLDERENSAWYGVPSSPAPLGALEGRRMRLPITDSQGRPSPVDRVVVAMDRLWITVTEANDSLARTMAIIDRLGRPLSGEAPTALAALTLDANAITRQLMPSDNRDETELPQAKLSASLAVNATGDHLDLRVEGPLVTMAQLAGTLDAELRPRRNGNALGAGGNGPQVRPKR